MKAFGLRHGDLSHSKVAFNHLLIDLFTFEWENLDTSKKVKVYVINTTLPCVS